ncbi:MAG: Beta-ketoacyl synthase, N-terminal domain, partial [Hyphomicrobiales bacterium]|nr:Beta-ketoacyl synthase, N-terminal domain [Hyphomicrobiales bacterium]
MRRVVVTGLGIVSAIGNNKQEVFTSLRDAKSGIVR